MWSTVLVYIRTTSCLVVSNVFTCVQSLVQTFHGLGFMLGPPIGGLLYSVPIASAQFSLDTCEFNSS